MNKILKVVFVLALFRTGEAYIDKNVYECLKDYNLTSLAQLIQETNLVTTLSGSGPFTVLAPTNNAVANIDPAIMVAGTRNKVLLAQIVRYHILSAYKVTPALINDGKENTIEGQPITISTDAGGVLINNVSRILGSSSDIICNNGIVHVIDTVLLPPVFSIDNLAAVMIQRDDIFKDFFMYVLLSDMLKLIETGEYTIFAPTDLAFGRYSHLNDIRQGTPNAASIYMEVLKYHMIPGSRTSQQLQDGQRLYSLHGSPVNITVNRNGVMVDAARVVEADIPASNGVIHAIDHVLFPPDLLTQLVQG